MYNGKLFLCGDIHGEMEVNKLSVSNWPEQKSLSVNDVLFILGDFALVWDEPESKSEKWWLKWLLEKKCTVCFIDGNHENHNKLAKYPIVYRWGGRVQVIKALDGKCIYRLMRGEIYNICNHKILTIGGADSTDKEYRIENKSWWSGETISNDDINNAIHNLSKHDYKVDYIFTHTAPQYIAKMLGLIIFGQPTNSMDQLARIEEITTFKEWHFGHFHMDENIYDTFFCHYNEIFELV